jgi:hypothetical protein
MVESAELVIKYCLSFGCHMQLESSPTCPLQNIQRKQAYSRVIWNGAYAVCFMSLIYISPLTNVALRSFKLFCSATG